MDSGKYRNTGEGGLYVQLVAEESGSFAVCRGGSNSIISDGQLLATNREKCTQATQEGHFSEDHHYQLVCLPGLLWMVVSGGSASAEMGSFLSWVRRGFILDRGGHWLLRTLGAKGSLIDRCAGADYDGVGRVVLV